MESKIKAEELRIGNLFIGYDDKAFNWGLREFSLLNDGVDIDEIIKSPIELTEEILIKVALTREKGEDFNFCYGDNQKYIVDTFLIGQYSDGWHYNRLGQKTGKPIKYIHQLQNLYFALTGKELNIEL